jgi:hypothetical protein
LHGEATQWRGICTDIGRLCASYSGTNEKYGLLADVICW